MLIFGVIKLMFAIMFNIHTQLASLRPSLQHLTISEQSQLAQLVWQQTLAPIESHNVATIFQHKPKAWLDEQLIRAQKTQQVLKYFVKAVHIAGIQVCSRDQTLTANPLPFFEMASRGGRIPLVFADQASANRFLANWQIAELLIPRSSSHTYRFSGQGRLSELKTNGIIDLLQLPLRYWQHKRQVTINPASLSGAYGMPFAAGKLAQPGFDGKPISIDGCHGEMLVLIERDTKSSKVAICVGFEPSSVGKKDHISGQRHLTGKGTPFSPFGPSTKWPVAHKKPTKPAAYIQTKADLSSAISLIGVGIAGLGWLALLTGIGLGVAIPLITFGIGTSIAAAGYAAHCSRKANLARKQQAVAHADPWQAWSDTYKIAPPHKHDSFLPNRIIDSQLVDTIENTSYQPQMLTSAADTTDLTHAALNYGSINTDWAKPPSASLTQVNYQALWAKVPQAHPVASNVSKLPTAKLGL